jgi:PIN domain nuclease of toxin-antitoxin system
MNFLLDTCTILWLQLDPSRVPASLRHILLRPETRRYSSAAAAWEIAIKWSLGKSLPIDEAPALQVAKLPGLHNDPFDRIRISQSIEDSLIPATPDPLIRQYAVRTMWD